MSNRQIRMVRVLLTEKERRELRAIAARKGISGAELFTTALSTSPATREAFKGEEPK